LERAKAVERAIKECIKQGILADYLNNNASEVSNMILQEWKIEDAKAVWQREAKEQADRQWELAMAQKDEAFAVALAEKEAELEKLRVLLAQK